MKRARQGRIARAVLHYLTFFALIAFTVTCCTMLFVSLLSDSLGIELTSRNLASAARLTFANVILISLIFTVLDALRRKWTVSRPLREITAAAEKMMQGDFSVRVKPAPRLASDDAFIEIVDCFNRMAEELSGVETLRTDFVASVSHEMKTPLTVMQNYAMLLQAPNLPEETRIEYAKALTDATRRLSSMVTNVLRLSRLESQQIYPDVHTYDLSEQLCASLLRYEHVWETRGIEIDTAIEEGVTVTADEELLSIVWSNLLSNAFKFTESGGKVTVSLTADETHALVRVSDTGCGMTAEVGAHIFEKFYQGDGSRASEGNGLGLALVRRVIDILQGEIRVESTPDVGSTFTVRLKR